MSGRGRMLNPREYEAMLERFKDDCNRVAAKELGFEDHRSAEFSRAIQDMPKAEFEPFIIRVVAEVERAWRLEGVYTIEEKVRLEVFR